MFFSYTHEGESWINVKWMYEVIFAFLSNRIGPEVVMILQMFSTLLILVLLKKLCFHVSSKKEIHTGIIGAGLLLLFINAERLNGRPEMTTYTLTAVYIYLFALYRSSQSKSILLLIPLQIFWTNMHEAYGVGVVIITIFLVGSWIEFFLEKKRILNKSIDKMMLPTIVGIIAIASIIINPNGTTMLSHYLEIYSQLKENAFTTENYSFTNSLYWNYASITNLILFLICTSFLYLNSSKGKIKIRMISILNTYGVVYLLLYFAFFYLSLQATRNSYFFAFISFPLYSLIINDVLQKIINDDRKRLMSLIVFGLLFYISIGSGFFYKNVIDREKYGLKISTSKNPLGAARFIKKNNIQGNGFVDYFSSSFLLWYLQPDFKTYIDLRDLDIYSQKFMENVFRAYSYPDSPLQSGETLFDYMDGIDRFEYVLVLNGPQFNRFNKYMIHQDRKFELVYADGLSSLYLRNTEKHAALIEKYGYKNGREIFNEFPEEKSSTFGNIISRMFWPFYTPYSVSNKEYRGIKREYFRMIK